MRFTFTSRGGLARIRYLALILFFSASVLSTGDLVAQVADPPAQDGAFFHPGLHCWIPAGGAVEPSATAPSLRAPGGPARTSRGTMTIVKSFPFPSGWLYARDAAWDGSYIWMGENFNSRIYKLDPASGSVVASFYAPASNPWGLAWDGTHLKNSTITMYHMPPGDTLPD